MLGKDCMPIKGLYAAGNASGMRFGWQYFTSIASQSISTAQTLGMLAGQNAAVGIKVQQRRTSKRELALLGNEASR